MNFNSLCCSGLAIMNRAFRRSLAVLFVFASAGVARADDFKSMVVASGATADLPRVHGDQFMVIRNFTQDDGSPRGFVTVTKPPNGGTSVKVLAAAVLDADPPDVINNVIIAGPADVSVTCGTTSGNCFISYRKDSN
ncbi:MAG TPA: hypothetical protein VKE30_09545 [Chthoniobacterales bacterium]|nr:hypothetical protein [Chthoniobacterales bacterium]